MKSGKGRSKQTPPQRRAKILEDLDEHDSLRADLDETEGVTGRTGGDLRSRATSWESSQHVQQLQGLACAITAQLDLHVLIKTILDQATALMGASRGILFLGRQDAAGLVPVLAQNIRGQELRAVEKVSRTILTEGKQRRLIITQDALSDARLAALESVRLNEMRSIVCTPLVSPSGQVGALYLDAPSPNAFPERALPLLDAMARVAAVALENAQVHGDLVRENDQLRRSNPSHQPWDRLLGPSERMEALRAQAATAALMDQPLLLVGENGSGRSILARAIHDASRRAREAFMTCDCAAMPALVLKGAVLGRSGVAVRGAYGNEAGLVRLADRGTLHVAGADALDEDLAGILARIAQRGLYRPLGGRRDERIDVRILASCEPDRTGERVGGVLLPAAFASIFHAVHLVVPPLRERSEDIPILVARFVRLFEEPSKGHKETKFSPDAIKLMQEQLWPGNIRELRHFVHRLLLSQGGSVIQANDVRHALAAAPDAGAAELGPWSGKIRSLWEWEQEAIRQTLLKTRGNKAESARLLGIHRNTLSLKLAKMKLEGGNR